MTQEHVGARSALTAGLERMFEEWAGNKPVEFPDMDKDPVSFWCWKAWQKASEIEREACASVCENQTEGFAATSTWDEAALTGAAHKPRQYGCGSGCLRGGIQHSEGKAMSIHVCKCTHNGREEFHLRYPGMSEAAAQELADKINGGGLRKPEESKLANAVKAARGGDAPIPFRRW